MIAADGVKKPSMRNVDVDVDGNIGVGVNDEVAVCGGLCGCLMRI